MIWNLITFVLWWLAGYELAFVVHRLSRGAR